MSMVCALGFGLGDGGGRVDACVDGVAADGDGWVEGFGVEVFEVDGFIIGPGHGKWHYRPQPREIWVPWIWRNCKSACFFEHRYADRFPFDETPIQVTSRGEP